MCPPECSRLGGPPSTAREGREHEWRVLFARPPPKPRVSNMIGDLRWCLGAPFASRFAPHGREVRNRHGQNSLKVANAVVGHSAEKARETGDPEAYNMFRTSDALLDMIDNIPYGDLPWTCFHVRYTGPITPQTPAWKCQTYVVYTRNPLCVAEAMARSSDFLQT